MHDIDPDQLDPRDAIRRTVQALHQAARITMRRCANRVVTDPVQRLTFAMALTRALSRGNHEAAARLLPSLPLFRQAVTVQQNGHAQVTDATLLDRLLADVVRDADAVHKDSNDTTPPAAYRHARVATQRQLTRWQALWLPFGRRVVLSKVPPDPTATGDSDSEAPADIDSRIAERTHRLRHASTPPHDRSSNTLPSPRGGIHDAGADDQRPGPIPAPPTATPARQVSTLAGHHPASTCDSASADGCGPPPDDAAAARDPAHTTN